MQYLWTNDNIIQKHLVFPALIKKYNAKNKKKYYNMGYKLAKEMMYVDDLTDAALFLNKKTKSP